MIRLERHPLAVATCQRVLIGGAAESVEVELIGGRPWLRAVVDAGRLPEVVTVLMRKGDLAGARLIGTLPLVGGLTLQVYAE